MNNFRGIIVLSSLIGVFGSLPVAGQDLPSSLSFTSAGSFGSPVSSGSDSVFLIDNDLTNGYEAGFDTYGAPSFLSPTGPSGAAAFQWGVAASGSSFPHTSALAFLPETVSAAKAEESFKIATLFYRNGTINGGTGVSAVDLAMRLSFSRPSGMAPIDVLLHADLINTPNGSDPVASADIVSLRNPSTEINFKDGTGNRYYLELTFQVDQDTMDGTLSTADQFHVFEGGGGTATLLGRFTTEQYVSPVPEPSAAGLLGFAVVLLAARRKRN